jgi:hypothetical protein
MNYTHDELVMKGQPMRTTLMVVVLAGILASPAFARLGETREQVLARYGKPTETADLGKIESLHFKKGAFTIFVEMLKETDRAVQIYYWKDTPFAPAQVAELLSRNAEGQLWDQSSYDMMSGKRSDGAAARGGMQKKEDGTARFMLAILSKNAGGVMEKSPADEAGQKAAKEIEGL